jgi:hypothetical protein
MTDSSGIYQHANFGIPNFSEGYDRVNSNQGAESTPAFQLSLAEMRQAQNSLTSFKEPIAIKEFAAARLAVARTAAK